MNNLRIKFTSDIDKLKSQPKWKFSSKKNSPRLATTRFNSQKEKLASSNIDWKQTKDKLSENFNDYKNYLENKRIYRKLIGKNLFHVDQYGSLVF